MILEAAKEKDMLSKIEKEFGQPTSTTGKFFYFNLCFLTFPLTYFKLIWNMSVSCTYKASHVF